MTVPLASIDHLAFAETVEDSTNEWVRSIDRLASAHLAVSLVAVLAAIATVAMWPAVRAGGQPLEVDSQAASVAWAALAYLLVTTIVELRSGLGLQYALRLPGTTSLVRLSAHALIVLACFATLGRGWHSLALLAGLDVTLCAALVVSALVLAVAGAERRLLSRQEHRLPIAEPASRTPESWMWLASQWCAALFFMATLANLEMQPVPHGEPAHVTELDDMAAADNALTPVAEAR